MRVLFLAADDPRGSTHRLASLLRQHSVAEARVVLLTEPRDTRLPVDVARIHDAGRELDVLLAEADIVHLIDLVPQAIPLLETLGKPPRYVLQWNRRLSVREEQATTAWIGEGARIITTVPGATSHHVAPFLPPVVNTARAPWCPLLPGTRQRSRGDTVRVFASSPGSLTREPALERLVELAEAAGASHPDLMVEVLSGRPPITLAQRQRRSHVVLAASDLGIPIAALEALAQGIPAVVASATPEYEAYAKLAGGILPPVFDAWDLELAIDEARPMEDPDLALRAWAQCVLDPRRWLALCSRTYAELARSSCVRKAA